MRTTTTIVLICLFLFFGFLLVSGGEQPRSHGGLKVSSKQASAPQRNASTEPEADSAQASPSNPKVERQAGVDGSAPSVGSSQRTEAVFVASELTSKNIEGTALVLNKQQLSGILGTRADMNASDGRSFGTLEGRVYRAGQPAAGVLILARLAIERGTDPVSSGSFEPHPDHKDAADHFVHQTSAVDGGYRFPVAANGRWELFVRGADAIVTMPSTIVDVVVGATTTRDLPMGASTIRGRFDVAQWAGRPQGIPGVAVFVQRLAGALDSPFEVARYSPETKLRRMPRLQVAADGAFVIADVPAGQWVVRLSVLGLEDLDLHAYAETHAGGQVELGFVTQASRVSLRVPVESTRQYASVGRFLGAHVRKRVADTAYWVDTEQFVKEVLTTMLDPGLYEVEFFVSDPLNPLQPVAVESILPAQSLLVRADGSTEPARLVVPDSVR